MGHLSIVYDFTAMPVTFDGVVALCGAAALATDAPAGDNLCTITFVRDSYRQVSQRDRDYSEPIKKWRSENILVRAAGLIKNVKAVTISDTRDVRIAKEDLLYPFDWSPDSPKPLPYNWQMLNFLDNKGVDFRLMKSGSQALEFMRSYLSDDKKNVSLSVRAADYNENRDSKLEDWKSLYRSLEDAGYHCVIIPDQKLAMSGDKSFFPRERVAWSAAIDLELRLAIYESCYGNITWTGGHSSILWLSQCNFINFGSLNSSLQISNNWYWNTYSEISTDTNIPFFLKNQIYDWTEASEVTQEYLIERSHRYLDDVHV